MRNFCLTLRFIAFFLGIAISQANAQTANHKSLENRFASKEKIDGDRLISKLLNDRYQFNKNLIKRRSVKLQLPKSSLLINKAGIVVFNKREYVFKDNQVIEIKGLLLPKSVLSNISYKVNALDNFQKICSDKVNAEYDLLKPNLQYIKTLDRQFFSALQQLSILTSSITKLSQKPNASITIELAMNEINIPKLEELNNGYADTVAVDEAGL